MRRMSQGAQISELGGLSCVLFFCSPCLKILKVVFPLGFLWFGSFSVFFSGFSRIFPLWSHACSSGCWGW